MDERITLTVNQEQAHVITLALDLYTRLGLGQLTELERMVRYGVIPAFSMGDDSLKVDSDQMSEIRDSCVKIKETLGYHRDGSYGLGHHNVHPRVLKAYEVMKVLEKTCAELKDPNPDFRGVNYDGLTVRYTSDPAPTASVVRDEAVCEPQI